MFNTLDPVEFSPYTRVHHIIGFDPSTGHSHGDLSALIVARIGMSTEGFVRICFGAGDDKYTHKLISDPSVDVPPLYQIVYQARDICRSFEMDSRLFGCDIKPLGVSDIIFNEWTKDVRIIDGGGKADINKTKKKNYGAVPYNKVTEMYLQLKQYIECGIVGGLPEEVLKWLKARKLEEVGDKTRLEAKGAFIKRTRLGSPDLLDAICMCLDTAIWVHGLELTRQKVEKTTTKMSDRLLVHADHRLEESKKKRVKLFNMKNIRRDSFRKNYK